MSMISHFDSLFLSIASLCSRANVVRFSMSLQLFTHFGMVPLYWAIIEGAKQSLIPHSCSVCRTVLTLCHESLFCEYNGVFNSAYDALLLKRFNVSI
jgi:hypothetical protein